MRFERYLNDKRRWPKGFQEIGSTIINTDLSSVTLGGTKGHAKDGEIDSLPETISMRARIKPVIFEDTSTTVQIIQDLKETQPYILYRNQDNDLEKYSCYEAIEFLFEGLVDIENTHLFEHLKPETVIGRRDFMMQSEPIIIHVDKRKVTPPGVAGGRPIWPYGGHFKAGCLIMEIEQTVFVAFSKQGHTEISISRPGTWLDHGVSVDGSLGKDGAQFMSDMTTHGLNLKGWIEKGHVTVNVPLGVDEVGAVCFNTYRSTSAQQPDRLNPIVEITFKKEE